MYASKENQTKNYHFCKKIKLSVELYVRIQIRYKNYLKTYSLIRKFIKYQIN